MRRSGLRQNSISCCRQTCKNISSKTQWYIFSMWWACTWSFKFYYVPGLADIQKAHFATALGIWPIFKHEWWKSSSSCIQWHGFWCFRVHFAIPYSPENHSLHIWTKFQVTETYAQVSHPSDHTFCCLQHIRGRRSQSSHRPVDKKLYDGINRLNRLWC